MADYPFVQVDGDTLHSGTAMQLWAGASIPLLTMHYPKDHLVVCRAQFREAPFQKIRYFRLPTACGAPFWPESIRITSIGSSCLTIQRG